MPDLFGDVATEAIIRSALISECGNYRYWLKRVWDGDSRLLCWCMLNPSTADHQQDDPTIRRCIGFSRAWGYTGLIVVNLFAWRATKPSELPDPLIAVGPKNFEAVSESACGRDVIAAWGAVQGKHVRAASHVRTLLRGCAKSVFCLGVTKGGYPRHPLYVPANAELASYREVQLA